MSIFTKESVYFSADRATKWNYEPGTGRATLYVDGVATFSASAGHTGSDNPMTVRRRLRVLDAATATLTADDSGALCVLDRAAGVVATLPAAATGLWFDFYVKTSVTSNAYKVITAAATTFLHGQLISVDTDSSNALAYDQVGNGTTHVAVNMNGTTTGGLIYTRFRLVCISATQWVIDGHNFGSGSVATPFATS